jgi:hypothetical protein
MRYIQLKSIYMIEPLPDISYQSASVFENGQLWLTIERLPIMSIRKCSVSRLFEHIIGCTVGSWTFANDNLLTVSVQPSAKFSIAPERLCCLNNTQSWVLSSE